MKMVVWITGLSGTGKSTIARALFLELRAQGHACLLLDGDEVREAVADPNTLHDPESRLRNAFRICRLARLAERQGLLVVVATMSLFDRIHVWNRENLEQHLEILVQVDLEELKARDAQGLYSRQGRGEERNVGGIDLKVELPLEPHLVLDNNQRRSSPEDHVERILALLSEATSADEAGSTRPGSRVRTKE